MLGADAVNCDADPERRATYLQTHREKRHATKRQGKVKAVKDFSEREKRQKRAYWRRAQRQREKASAREPGYFAPESSS